MHHSIYVNYQIGVNTFFMHFFDDRVRNLES